MKRKLLTAALVVALSIPAVQVGAWGATGHRLVAEAAMRALPDEVPAFLRSQSAIADVAEIAREPDRWKGGGQPHDSERDLQHFVDLNDSYHVMTDAGPSIDALPERRAEYDTALVRAGIDLTDAGYLPYALMDGYQQVVRDFAYWRVLNAAEARETNPERRAWYRADRERRERLLIRDLGIWAHYVGDGSQPLHTSIHYNGWGDYPNPEGFTMSRRTHALVEGAYVPRNTRLSLIQAGMSAPTLDGFDLRARTASYIRGSVDQVAPLYRLEKAGAFAADTPEGAEFITAQLARGASELRDLTVLAWRESAGVSIGWPVIKVADVEAGADPWISLVGED